MDKPPIGEAKEPPKDRFCDLIMKGGITSGIVYPRAIALLAEHYRFKSIGGTSAGAIAAALTAAAEYNRRCTDSTAGFELLKKLPSELASRAAGSERSKLLSLFQPQAGTRRLFSVLARALNRANTYSRLGAIFLGLMIGYWFATLVACLVAAAAYFVSESVLAACLAFAGTLIVAIGGCLYFDITRNLVRNGFGLCTGLTEDKSNPALTPWLHNMIQTAAGLSPTDPPLTFGMLWNAPGFPPAWLKIPEGTEFRSIDLQMFATNLGHGRPYVFPLTEEHQTNTRFRDRERLFFKVSELEGYLPADVMEWMKSHGRPYQPDNTLPWADPSIEEAMTLGLIELPTPEQFPVILAARMSLSFPFLFAALPLWAINYDRPVSVRHFQRCWFSDGGISSNFPMHLFDGLLPLWPTFGINLEPKIAGRDLVYLPKNYEAGYGERWENFDEQRNSAAKFGGFASAILRTMQNWNDNSLSRMPGVRDRIARVRLERNEGGLNLDMTEQQIDAVANKGSDAARELVQRFAAANPANSDQTQGWNEHRFVRFNVLLKLISARLSDIQRALDPDSEYATDYQSLITLAASARLGGDGTIPPGFESMLTPEQVDELRESLRLLREAIQRNPNVSNSGFRTIPKPELRVRPPL